MQYIHCIPIYDKWMAQAYATSMLSIVELDTSSLGSSISRLKQIP